MSESTGGSRPVRQAEVCRELGCSSAHVSKSISILRAAGLFLAGWETVGKGVPKGTQTGNSPEPKSISTDIGRDEIEPSPPEPEPTPKPEPPHLDDDQVEQLAAEEPAELVEARPTITVHHPAWKAQSLGLTASVARVLEVLPDDPSLARQVLSLARRIVSP